MTFKAITFYDWLLVPFYLFFIFLIAQFIRKRNIEKYPEYKYLFAGLAFKIFGAMMLVFIYVYYYEGGDTVVYFHDALCWNRLLMENPIGFYHVFLKGTAPESFVHFSSSTGWPLMYNSPDTNNVIRLSFLATLLGARSFLVASILFATLSFGGIWKMYRVFVAEFPHLYQKMVIPFLFIPSVVFWGSGILKDTITMTCLGYFFSSFYVLLIKRRKFLSNIFSILLSSYFILSIKPYIFIALVAGIAMWLVSHSLSKIKGSFIRGMTSPILLISSLLLAYFTLKIFSNQLGQFRLDNLLEKAVITQMDLKADYYKGNAFDIGELEPTVESMLRHSHLAIEAALFRPYIWEANNIVMFISGMENLWFLILTLTTLIKARVFEVFKYFVKHHLLTFSLIFSIFFAFSVGISTSNFGSLVRYRIPILPFYVSSLMIINWYINTKKVDQEAARIPAPAALT